MPVLDEDIKALREMINERYEPTRERSLALTKLDEVELWLAKADGRV